MERSQYISEAFISKIGSKMEHHPGALIVAGGLVAAAIAIGNKYFSYYGRRCHNIVNKQERKNCMFDVKIEAHKHTIEQLKKDLSSVCPKSKDPDKCKQKIGKNIRKFENEIERLERLKKQGKWDIASALTSRGAHPAHRVGVTAFDWGND
jgi:hypothetical protein